MFKPLVVFIALRYTRAKKRNHFISFISLTSMVGIALGVTVLITVLSVMNGFDKEIHQRFFGMAPEITVNHRDGKMLDWQARATQLQQYPGVVAIAPFVSIQALLTANGQVVPVMVTGVIPEKEQAMSHLSEKLLLGKLSDLHHFGILVGRNLAENLGAILDDPITVMIPEASVTPGGMLPRFKRFHLAGVFSVGTGFNFDSRLAFIDLEDAQKLLHLGDAVTGLKLKIKEVYAAPQIARAMQEKLGEAYEVSSWVDQFGPFFHAVKMEKTMMFFILLLIIAVATFNLISSLVMIVNDKQSEIAILRTMGARPQSILAIFMVQGMIVGCVGTLMGLIGGVILSENATAIVHGIERVFHTQFLSANIYFVDYLPSRILLSDLLWICGLSLGMSFIATLYPAWRASKTIIAGALHYE